MKKLTILAMIALIGASCTKPTPKPVNEIADNLSEIENRALYIDAAEIVVDEFNNQLHWGEYRKYGFKRVQAAVDTAQHYIFKEISNQGSFKALREKALSIMESKNTDSLLIGRYIWEITLRTLTKRKVFETRIDTLLSAGRRNYRMYSTDGFSYIVEIRNDEGKSKVVVAKESKNKR